jgi:hypothetical protein
MFLKRLWVRLATTETEHVTRTDGPVEGKKVEPVRDAEGRLDVEASVRRIRRQLWTLYLLPGGRRTMRLVAEGARHDLIEVAENEGRD